MTSDSSAALQDAVAELLQVLLATLDALDWAQRRLHPGSLGELAQRLEPLAPRLDAARTAMAQLDWPDDLRESGKLLEKAAEIASSSLAGFVDGPPPGWMATLDPSSVFPLYAALRRRVGALEALYPLCSVLAPVSRFFLEPRLHDDVDLLTRLSAAHASPASDPPVGHIDGKNARTQRGGFSLYVPEYYDAVRPWPLVVTLHGGSGHGADMLWTWLREARGRGCIVLSPTSIDRTWSLMQPRRDGERLEEMVAYVIGRWNVDSERVLLTGMSDGGTFTLAYGFSSSSPFTHLAPLSGVLPPLSAEAESGVAGKPVYLVHGALDWMFPVVSAQAAQEHLLGLGAELTYREIPDLSHTYPREENARILEWMERMLP